MKLKYVEIENILSIGKIRLDFEENGIVLLDGWNHDDNSANGAGKTACFIAIPFALWDKFPRKISKSEILRKGSKKGYVKVGLYTSDGALLEVVRCRPNKVEFYKDGEKLEITQDNFEQMIGLSYFQYLVTMYSAQTEGQKLIGLNDTSKKDFILGLMDLDNFSLYKKKADTEIKELIKSRQEIYTILAQCESKLELYGEQTVDISAIQAQIDALDTTDLNNKLVEYSNVPKPDVSKYVDLRKKLNDSMADINKTEADIKSWRSAIAMNKSAIDRLDKADTTDISCPECDSSLVVSSSGVSCVDDYNSKIESQKAEHNDEIKKYVDMVNSAPNTSVQKNQIEELVKKSYEKQQKDEDVYNNAIMQCGDLKSKIFMRQSQIDVLNDQIQKQDDILNKMKDIEDIKVKANSKIQKLDSEIGTLEAVSSIFSPTGAPAYIMDFVIDLFNEKMMDHVSTLWPNASYKLQSFKENKSGEIKAKFSDKLVINGRDRSIGSLSGGEYRCLSLAMDFAILDVVESVFSSSLNPIVLDEPFEGLDATNRERVINLLEKRSVDRQIWIVDHAAEARAMFSKIMRIEKKQGISSLMI